MSTEPIPDDVIAHIIDHLEDDTTTLKSCALVSHTVHKYAYKAIFSTLDLNAFKKTSLGTSQIVRIRRMFIFFEFKPYLVYSVRTLRISAAASSVFNTTKKDVEPTVTLWHVVPKLLRELPNLVELDLNTGYAMLSALVVKGGSAPYPVNVDAYTSHLKTISLGGGCPFEFFSLILRGTEKTQSLRRLVLHDSCALVTASGSRINARAAREFFQKERNIFESLLELGLGQDASSASIIDALVTLRCKNVEVMPVLQRLTVKTTKNPVAVSLGSKLVKSFKSTLKTSQCSTNCGPIVDLDHNIANRTRMNDARQKEHPKESN